MLDCKLYRDILHIEAEVDKIMKNKSENEVAIKA